MPRLALVLFFFATAAAAHPSTGIVVAPNGDVFRITPRGERSVAVRNVHAHELVLEDGAVAGEDVNWEGGDRYRHRFFKRTPDGRVTKTPQARSRRSRVQPRHQRLAELDARDAGGRRVFRRWRGSAPRACGKGGARGADRRDVDGTGARSRGQRIRRGVQGSRGGACRRTARRA